MTLPFNVVCVDGDADPCRVKLTPTSVQILLSFEPCHFHMPCPLVSPAKSGIPKRKKTKTYPRLSCKIEYLLTSNHSDGSIASEFLTGDQIASNFILKSSLVRPSLLKWGFFALGGTPGDFKEDVLSFVSVSSPTIV